MGCVENKKCSLFSAYVLERLGGVAKDHGAVEKLAGPMPSWGLGLVLMFAEGSGGTESKTILT